jgi:signal transduction histidine kinase
MSEDLRTRLHESVFIKLVAVMLTTAAAILLIVAFFFGILIGPIMGTLVERVVGDYTHILAARSPDLQAARELAARLEVQIRYEGPEGSWATDPGLPSIAEVEGWRHGVSSRIAWGQGPYIIPASGGGTYLFSWEFGHHLREAHRTMLWLLLFFVVGVLFAAHLVLSRLLRPLRSLHQGVVRLSEGQLDITLPNRTRDEFGVLTGAFNQMVGRIREMLRARDQLLLDVSHELRSPLTRMKVALALLPEGDKRQRIASDVAEMEAMITELLDLERLRNGRGIQTEPRNLVPILREMAESFEDRPPGVRVASAPREILLDIDGDRIRTVLRNLLENAIKYSLPESGPVEVSAEDDGETVVVRVTDDGPGVPPADLPNLFEPFFRVDRSRSKKSGGYGLGLSICKRIMEAHGGDITAENHAGRGASFTLTFRRSSPSRLPALIGAGRATDRGTRPGEPFL